MRGTLALAKTSPLAGDRPAPNAVTLLYTVPPAKKKADEDSSKPDGEEAPLEALKQARRDADVRARLRLPLSHAVQLCAASMPGSSVPIRSICTLFGALGCSACTAPMKQHLEVQWCWACMCTLMGRLTPGERSGRDHMRI